jgi:hypothetical protein
MNKNGVLSDVFHRDDKDKEIIRQWLLEGSLLPNETLEHSNPIHIRSHQAFKLIY